MTTTIEIPRPGNAATLALRKPDIYMYVEGYAVNRWIAMHTVAHAWCINSDNFVVDPTWDEGTDYFGVDRIGPTLEQGAPGSSTSAWPCVSTRKRPRRNTRIPGP